MRVKKTLREAMLVSGRTGSRMELELRSGKMALHTPVSSTKVKRMVLAFSNLRMAVSIEVSLRTM